MKLGPLLFSFAALLSGSAVNADVVVPKTGAPISQEKFAVSVARQGHLVLASTGMAYDARLADGSDHVSARQALAGGVIEALGDHYDFIVVAPTFRVELGPFAGLHWQVSNQVGGIGRPMLDVTEAFGSQGRLKAVIDLDDALVSPAFTYPGYDALLDTLMHEIMHQWGVYISYPAGPGAGTPISTSAKHWSSKLDSDASVMFGARWAAATGGFRQAAVRSGYGPLDLYLAGFIDANEVPPSRVIITSELRGDELPELGRTVAGTSVELPIATLLGALGPRQPAYPNTQREYTAALVVLQSVDHPASLATLDRIDQLRLQARTRFAAITRGRARLELGISPASSALAASAPNSVSSTAQTRATVDLALARSYLLGRRQDGLWQDKASTRVRDSVRSVQALESDASAHAGVLNDAIARITGVSPANRDELTELLQLERFPLATRLQLSAELLATQAEGGFAFADGLQRATLDTALALRSLARVPAQAGVGEARAAAAAWLRAAHKGSENCWSLAASGPCDFLASVSSVHALALAGDGVNHAVGLFRWQRANGGFGVAPAATAFETALALRALHAAGLAADTRTLAAEAHLQSTQRVDGSWDGSVAATAEAVLVLAQRQLPDLAVEGAWTLTPAGPVRGQLVEARALLRNLGAQTAVASQYTIEARRGDAAPTVLASGEIAGLPGGAQQTLLHTLDTRLLEPGAYRLILTLDSGQLVAESDEGNNRIERSLDILAPPSLPELLVVLQRVDLSPTVVTVVPQAMRVAFGVENIGLAAANDVAIRLAGWRFGELRTLATVRRDLAPTSRINLAADITLDDLDISKIVVIVDAEGTISEANENNNSAEALIDRQPTIDLAIASDDVQLPANPQQATPATLSLRARNLGTRDSPVTRIRIALRQPDNSTVVLAEQDLQIAAASSVQRAIPFTPTQAGTHRLQVALDPANNVTEIREDNNSLDIPLEVSASSLPNLRIDPNAWLISPNPARQGSPVSIRARVVNPSAHSAAASVLELAWVLAGNDQFQTIGRANVPTLAAGAHADVEVAAPTVSAGSALDVLARVDVDNVVVEANESDNESLYSLPVLALPNLQLSAIDTRVEPSAPPPGSSARVRTLVRNSGGQDVSSVSIELLAGDSLLAPRQNLTDLAAGAVRDVEFQFTRPPAGTAIRLAVDRAAAVVEGREDDNSVTLNLDPLDPDFYATEPYFSPNGDGVADRTTIVARWTGAATARLRILSSWGAEVARFQAQGSANEISAQWDGRRPDQTRALDDRYDVLLEDAAGTELKRLQIVLDTNRHPVVLAAREGMARLSHLSCDLSGLPPASWDEFTTPGSASFPGTDFIVARSSEDGQPDSEGIYRLELGRPPRLLLARRDTQSFDLSRWHVFMESAEAVMVALPLVSGLELRRISSLDGSSLADPVRIDGAERYLGKLDSGHRIFVGNGSLYALSPQGQVSALASDFDPAVLPVVGRDRVLTKKPGPRWDFRLVGLSGAIDANTGVEIAEQQRADRFEYGYSRVARAFFWATGATPVYVNGLVPERLLRINEANGNMVTLASADSRLANLSVTISPDGARMLLVEGNAGRGRLYDFERGTETLIDLSLVAPQATPFAPQFPVGRVLSDPVWSPDARQLAANFAAYQDADRSPDQTLARRGFLLSADGTLRDLGDSFPRAWVNGELQILGDAGNDGIAIERGLDRADWLPATVDPAHIQLRALDTDGRAIWMQQERVGDACAGSRPAALTSTANGLAEFSASYEAALRTLLLRASINDLSFQRYSLAYQRVGEAAETEIFSGNSALDDEILGAWSPPAPGRYRLLLRVLDRAGNETRAEREIVWFEIETLGLVRSDLRDISPNGDGVQDSVTVTYELRAPTNVQLRVVDAAGSPVRVLERVHAAAGSYQWTWDGRRDNGQLLPDGAYQIEVDDRAIPVVLDTVLPQVQSSQPAVDRVSCGESPTIEAITIGGFDRNWGSLQLESRRPGSASWGVVRSIASAQRDGTIGAVNLALTPSVLRHHEFRLVGLDRAGNRSTQAIELNPLHAVAGRTSRGSPPVFQPWVQLGPGIEFERSAPPTQLWVQTLVRQWDGWQLEYRRSGTTAWTQAAFQRVPLGQTGPDPERACLRDEAEYVRIDLGWLDASAGAELRFRHNGGQISRSLALNPRGGSGASSGGGSGGGGGSCNVDMPSICERVGAESAWVAGACQPLTSVRWLDPRTGTFVNLPILEQRPGRARISLAALPVGQSSVQTATAEGFSTELQRVGRRPAEVPAPVVDQPLSGSRLCLSRPNAIVGEVRTPFVDSVSARLEWTDPVYGASELTGGQQIERAYGPDGTIQLVNTQPAAFGIGGFAFPTAFTSSARLSVSASHCGATSSTVERTLILDHSVLLSRPAVGRSSSATQTPAVLADSAARTPVAMSPALGHHVHVVAQAQEALLVRARVRAIGTRPSLTLAGWSGAWETTGPVLMELPTRETTGGELRWTWDGRIAGSPAADRDYGIELLARDTCGEEIRFVVPVLIDATAPTLSWQTPDAGSTVSLFQPLRSLATDASLQSVQYESLAPGASQWLLIQRLTVPSTATQPFLAQAQWHSSVAPGTWRLRVSARDEVGNLTHVEREVIVPQRTPLVTQAGTNSPVISPNGDGLVDSVELSWQLSRTGLISIAIVDASGTLVRNLLPETPLSGAQSRSWNGQNDAAQVLPDGQYQIRLRVTDPAAPGNVEHAEFPVLVDRSPPQIEWLAPAGAISNGRGPLRIRLVEANPRVLSASAQPALPGLQTQHSGSGELDLAILDAVPEGSYRLNLTAEDLGGNRASRSLEFSIDRTPPQATLTQPATGSVVSRLRGPLQVRGSVADARLASWRLLLDGVAAPIASNSNPSNGNVAVAWDGIAADGPQTLRLQALDTAGNLGEASLPIVLDNTPPVARIDAPAENAHVGADFEVSGTASDANFASLELAVAARPGGAYNVLLQSDTPVSSGLLGSLQAPAGDGAYVLRLRVRDVAGTVAEDFVDISVDTVPPPAPLGLTAERQGPRSVRLTIQGTTHPDVLAYRILRQGQAVAVISGTTHVDADLADGLYRYRAVALDRAGNPSAPSPEASVRIDTTAPEVLISRPLPGARVGGRVEIQGRAYSREDFDQYELVVEGLQPPTAAQTLTQRSSAVQGGSLGVWDTRSIPAATVRLTLRARDLSGNQASTQTEIAVDNQPPAAPTGVVALEEGSADVRISWQANTEADLLGYLVYRDAALLNGTPEADPRLIAIAQTEWLDSGLGDGEFAWRVAAIDSTGNISAFSTPATLQRSGRPPRVVLVRPIEGARFDPDVAVRGQSSDLDLSEVRFEVRAEANGAWQAFGPLFTAPPFDSRYVPTPRAYGFYRLRAQSRDSEGLVDTAPPELRVEYRDLTAPPRVQSLTASVDGAAVSLAWSAVEASDLSGYRLERAQGDGEFSLLAMKPANALSHVDTGLSDAAYRYRVLAVDSADNRAVASPLAHALIHQPQATQPYAPTLQASTATSIRSAVAGSLQIEHQSASGTVNLPALGIAAGQALLVNLPLNDGENQFRFRVLDAQGQRSKLATLEVLRTQMPPVPTALTANVNGYVSTLRWQAATHPYPLGFRVLRGGIPVQADQRRIPTQAFVDFGGLPQAAPDLLDANPATAISVGPEQPIQLDLRLDAAAVVTAIELEFDGTAPALDVQARARWRLVDVPLATSLQINGNSTSIALAEAYRADRFGLTLQSATAWQLTEVRVWVRPVQSAAELIETLPDGRHRYRVQSINQHAVHSLASEPLDVDVGDAVAPAPPVLTGSVNGSTVSLTWTQATTPDLVEFWVMRGSTRIATLPAGARSHSDPGLLNGAYGYTVFAVDTVGNNAGSNLLVLTVDVGTLAAPSGLTASATGSGGSVDLSWQPGPGAAPAGYRLTRALAEAGPYASVLDLPGTSHRDTGLNNGTRYYYRVRARDAVGNLSAESNTASATPFSDTPVITPVFVYPTRHGQSVTVPETQTVVTGRGQIGSTVQVGVGQRAVGVPVLAAPVLRSISAGLLSPDARHLLSGGELRRVSDGALLASVGTQCAGQWLNAHRLLVCESGGQLNRLDLPAVTRTPIFALPQLYAIRMAPDARRMAVLGVLPGGSDQVIAWRDGVAPWRVIAPAAGIEADSLRFDPSSRWLLWRQNNRWQRYDLQTEQSLTLSLDDSSAAVSFARRTPYALIRGTVAGVPGLYRVDLATATATRVDVPLSGLRAVDLNSDDTLLGVATASALHFFRWPDLSPLFQHPMVEVTELTSQPTDLWLADTASGLRLLQTPGTFLVDALPLNPGDNILAAIASAPGQLDSQPALPITVTVPADGLPDLSVRSGDLSVLPANPTPGSAVRLGVRVRNIGVTASPNSSLRVLLAGPDGNALPTLQLPIPAMAAGAERVVSSDTPILNQAGIYSLTVRVNPEASFAESSLSNNVASRSLVVSADGQPELMLRTDRERLGPGETLAGSASVSTGALPFSGRLRLAIVDEREHLVVSLSDEALDLGAAETLERQLRWTPAAIAAGSYRVRATLSGADGRVVRQREQPVTVEVLRSFALSVSPSQQSQTIGTPIAGTVRVQYLLGNVAVEGAELRSQLLTASGVLVATRTDALPAMSAGFSSDFAISFASSALAAGSYAIRSELWAGPRLAEGGAAAILLAPAGVVAITGRWLLPSTPLAAGAPAELAYEVRNTGGTVLQGIPIRVTARRQLEALPVASREVTLDLAAGATQQGTLEIPVSAMNVGVLVLAIEVRSGPLIGVLDLRSAMVVDALAPQLTILQPAPGQIVPRQFDIAVRALDTHSFVARVESRLGNAAFAPMSAVGNSAGEYRRYVSGLSDGPLTLGARAEDAHGNIAVSSPWTVTVDGAAPTISISGVSDGGIYATPVSAQVSVSDAHPASTVILLNGLSYVSGTSISADGRYTLVVIATDQAGNRAQRSLSFEVDRLAPSVNFVFPANLAVINAAATEVRIQTEAAATVQLLRGTQQYQSTASATGLAVFASVALNEGSNVLRATAVDPAGNASAPAEITVIRSTSTLGLLAGTIQSVTGSVEPGADLSGNASLVSSSTQPLSDVPVRLSLVAGAGQTMAQRQWQLSFAPGATQIQPFNFSTGGLGLGGYTLLLEAQLRDTNGQSVWVVLAQRPVTLVDATPPQVVLQAPVVNQLMRPDLSAEASVFDALSGVESVMLRIDQGVPQPMSASGNSYSLGLSNLSDGSHSAQVLARDGAGNQRVEPEPARPFRIDGTPPVIEISGISDGQLSATPVTPVIAVSDTHPGTQVIRLNGQLYASGTQVSADGEYLLRVEAIDGAGNRAERELRFTIDRTPPQISISAPNDNSSTASTSIPVVAQTEGLIEVALVDATPPYVLRSDAQGMVRFAAVWLSPGENILRLRARDRAGNPSAVAQVRVLRLTASPTPVTAEILVPASMPHGEPLTGTLRVTSTQAASTQPDEFRLEVLRGNGSVALTLDWSRLLALGQIEDLPIALPTSGLPAGELQLQVRWRRALAPNTPYAIVATRSLNLIDQQAPSLEVIEPVAGATVSDPMSVLVRAEDPPSGIASVSWRLGNGSWQALSPATSPPHHWRALVPLPQPGAYTISVRAIDAAGNTREIGPIPVCRVETWNGFADGFEARAGAQGFEKSGCGGVPAALKEWIERLFGAPAKESRHVPR